MFDYIVCFYFGNRRMPLTNLLSKGDRYGFVKRHIEFLDKIKNTSEINRIIFAINGISDKDEKMIKRLLSESNLSNYKVIFRDNIDYSYGAWNHALIDNLDSESRYAFLIEDDYIPSSTKFHEHFIKMFDDHTAYVCQYYDTINKIKHAGISNGFIDYYKCREVYEKHKNIFKLVSSTDSKDYIAGSAETNQVLFLDYFTKEFGYGIKDITEENYSLYLHINKGQPSSVVKLYGNEDGLRLITPILELPPNYQSISDTMDFRKINRNDLEFINIVRNEYAAEYLHDSRTFTLDESIDWFEKYSPNFYIIELNEQPIGYFRLSNHSIYNKNIYIGADISSDFKGRGYGKAAYKKFIPFLFEEYDLNKISLEVLATNTVAISLYEKLGFKTEGIKRQEIKKGDVWVDSIVMSILKNEYE